MDKMIFIINPVAGGGKAQKLIPTIEKIMDETRIKYDIVLTTKPKDAIKISKIGRASCRERV